MLLDLTALMHQCAPAVGITTMRAIIRTESGGEPWIIGDNTDGRVYRFASKAAATSSATALIASGHSLDLGLGQINSHNLPALRLTVAQVLDPCTNLAASATVLTAAYQRAVKQYGAGQKALLAAVSAYNTGSLVNGFGNGYVLRVISNAGKPIAIHVPNLVATATHVNPSASQSPYTAPLTAWARGSGHAAAPNAPSASPLEADGFSHSSQHF